MHRPHPGKPRSMSNVASTLVTRKCKPSSALGAPLTQAEIDALLTQLTGWRQIGGSISKTYVFADYWHTMAFVNATAWVSHREDHHPDLSVGYKTCKVDYTTHAVDGLSENDFICAAKVDALFSL